MLFTLLVATWVLHMQLNSTFFTTLEKGSAVLRAKPILFYTLEDLKWEINNLNKYFY